MTAPLARTSAIRFVIGEAPRRVAHGNDRVRRLHLPAERRRQRHARAAYEHGHPPPAGAAEQRPAGPPACAGADQLQRARSAARLRPEHDRDAADRGAVDASRV